MRVRFGFILLLAAGCLPGQWRKTTEPAKTPVPVVIESIVTETPSGWRRVGEAPRTPRPTLETTPPITAGAPPESIGGSVIFRAETREVNVTFSATGRNGGALAELTKSDVEVYEDGARRTITHFSRDRD